MREKEYLLGGRVVSADGYKKDRSGEINNFTGIYDPYEEPVNSEIYLKTNELKQEGRVEKIINYLRKNNYIN